jgi:hypothetical protein
MRTDDCLCIWLYRQSFTNNIDVVYCQCLTIIDVEKHWTYDNIKSISKRNCASWDPCHYNRVAISCWQTQRTLYTRRTLITTDKHNACNHGRRLDVEEEKKIRYENLFTLSLLMLVIQWNSEIKCITHERIDEHDVDLSSGNIARINDASISDF